MSIHLKHSRDKENIWEDPVDDRGRKRAKNISEGPFDNLRSRVTKRKRKESTGSHEEQPPLDGRVLNISQSFNPSSVPTFIPSFSFENHSSSSSFSIPQNTDRDLFSAFEFKENDPVPFSSPLSAPIPNSETNFMSHRRMTAPLPTAARNSDLEEVRRLLANGVSSQEIEDAIKWMAQLKRTDLEDREIVTALSNAMAIDPRMPKNRENIVSNLSNQVSNSSSLLSSILAFAVTMVAARYFASIFSYGSF